MERCTAYSTVASGASAEALIEKSRCLLATCCSGKRAIGAARQAVPLSLSGDGHLHAMVSLRSVWWCRAAFCCSAIATSQWNYSGGSQSRLLSASFWQGLHFPVYLGALAGPRSHRSACHFCKDLAFWSLKTRKFFWPAGACHRCRSFTHFSHFYPTKHVSDSLNENPTPDECQSLRCSVLVKDR